jgi:hypothetical protein
MTTERAEAYRRPHPLGGVHKTGDSFGWFEIPVDDGPRGKLGPKLRVLVAPADKEWQHISVSRGDRCPTWEDMCKVKDLFFDPEEVVVQFHPRKSEYVNLAKNCLHLWRLNDGREFPTPPSILVGI